MIRGVAYRDPVDMHVGMRIRSLRASFGWSLAELSEKAGVSVDLLKEYESGRSSISAGMLYQVARALGVSVSFFFEEIAKV